MASAVGGRERRRVVFLLACVLSLDSADKGTVGALAPQLERQFHIGNTKIGLLVTASSLIGVLVTLPMGILADRVRRVRLLKVAIATWAAAMLASSFAGSYEMLLATRLALGALIAAAGPVVASLTGDYFDASERGNIYGYLLTGELLGSGLGLLVSGDIGAAAGWRVGFAILAVPGVALAIAVHKLLPEPGRGGKGRLPGRAGAAPGARSRKSRRSGPRSASRIDLRQLIVREARRRPDVPTDRSRRPPDDPAGVSIWAAARYVLAVPSNRVFIASSALGYFFLSGVRSFAVIYAKGHFGIGQGAVSLLLVMIGAGAVLGTLSGGRLADRLIRRKKADARVIVAGATFLAAPVLFLPGLISTSVAISLPLLMIAGFLLAAPNPPLDASRLDVMPAGMWGRAESVRTFVRTLFESFAPLLFGFVSAQFGATAVGFGAGVNSNHAAVSAQNSHGIELTFLVMLIPLALSGLLLLRRRTTYLADVAAVAGDEHKVLAVAGDQFGS